MFRSCTRRTRTGGQTPTCVPTTHQSVPECRLILEDNHRTPGLASVCDQFVADRMQHLREPVVFFASNNLSILVCPPSPVFLQVTSALLVFSAPVVKFVTTPEPTRTGDGKIIYAEVTPENRSVLDGCLRRRVYLRVCCATYVKLLLTVLPVEFSTGDVVLTVEEIL